MQLHTPGVFLVLQLASLGSSLSASGQVLDRSGGIVADLIPRTSTELIFVGAIADFNTAFGPAGGAVDLGLDRPISIKLTGCDAGMDYWDPDAEVIAICHGTVRGLVHGIGRQILADAGDWDAAARQEEAWGPLPSMALPFLIAHELAHAIIDLSQIPVPGNLEIAADELAAVLLLENAHHGNSIYAGAVTEGARFLHAIAKLEQSDRAVTSRHGSSKQRAHALHCLSVGARTAHRGTPTSERLHDRGGLTLVSLDSLFLTQAGATPERFEQCFHEYDRVVVTWYELLTPAIEWRSGGDHRLKRDSRN